MKLRTLLPGTIALICLAGTANGQITGTDHDFSTTTWSNNEICKPCHTPHFANVAAGKLWNHSLPSAAQAYTLYGGSAGTLADFDSTTKLCLGCHDGTVALDAFGGSSGTAGNTMPTDSLIGTDLSNDHPIGKKAIYPTAVDGSHNPQNTSHQVSFTWGTLRLRTWVDGTGTTQYVVGCKTCHNPHTSSESIGTPPVSTPIPHMLYINNTGSHLCLTCHIK